jgi:nitrite reductase/ring-hydroxylating ferredoxin subunit
LAGEEHAGQDRLQFRQNPATIGFENNMPSQKVALLRDFPPGSAREVKVAGKSIAIFNVDGEFFAIGNECTHEGAPLSEGAVNEGCVVCPWHGAEFDLRTGEALTPPAVESVGSYQVVVSDGEISIAVE